MSCSVLNKKTPQQPKEVFVKRTAFVMIAFLFVPAVSSCKQRSASQFQDATKSQPRVRELQNVFGVDVAYFPLRGPDMGPDYRGYPGQETKYIIVNQPELDAMNATLASAESELAEAKANVARIKQNAESQFNSSDSIAVMAMGLRLKLVEMELEVAKRRVAGAAIGKRVPVETVMVPFWNGSQFTYCGFGAERRDYTLGGKSFIYCPGSEQRGVLICYAKADSGEKSTYLSRGSQSVNFTLEMPDREALVFRTQACEGN
jgi:hypothetical protein